jgi:hypothetical protein
MRQPRLSGEMLLHRRITHGAEHRECDRGRACLTLTGMDEGAEMLGYEFGRCHSRSPVGYRVYAASL